MEGGIGANFCSLLQLSLIQGKNELTFLDSWPTITWRPVPKLRGLLFFLQQLKALGFIPNA